MDKTAMTGRKQKRSGHAGVIFLIAALFMFPFVPHISAAEPSARKAIVAEMSGAAEMRENGGGWKPAYVGAVLFELDELRTGDGTEAELLLDDGGATGKLNVAGNTHIRFRSLAWDELTKSRETLIDVAVGRINLFVNKLRNESKFEVNTPTATIGVRGTIFEVNVARLENGSQQAGTAG